MPTTNGIPPADHVTAAEGRFGAVHSAASGNPRQLASARSVRDAFDSFVGQTFFSQMLKAMRSSVGRPAYFHGGRAEEMFLSQLDQTMAEKMAEQSGPQLADPMFRSQFPELAEALASAPPPRADLNDLNSLGRRL